MFKHLLALFALVGAASACSAPPNANVPADCATQGTPTIDQSVGGLLR
jgi:hypothetical protein